MKIRASYFAFCLLMLLILFGMRCCFSPKCIIPFGLNIFSFPFLEKSISWNMLNVLCFLFNALAPPLPSFPHNPFLQYPCGSHTYTRRPVFISTSCLLKHMGNISKMLSSFHPHSRMADKQNRATKLPQHSNSNSNNSNNISNNKKQRW